MKKRLFYIILATVFVLSDWSCVRDNEFESTPMGNFEACWQLIDRYYCSFDVKEKEYGLDWDSIHNVYKAQIKQSMTNRELFNVLAGMLNELHDAHVNLISPFQTSYYKGFYLDYEPNFSNDFLSRSTRYWANPKCLQTGAMKYMILEPDYDIKDNVYIQDSIGYIYYGDFTNTVSDYQIYSIFDYFRDCIGIIIDVRGNGGGDDSFAYHLPSFFTDSTITVGYMKHKTGPGHNDFSELIPTYISPAKNNLRWQKPVALIVNRGCFSAANDFAVMMKEMPKVRLIGDMTGGGGGMPISSELPNGWSVRFSSAPSFDARGEHVEGGIDPHQQVSLTDSDKARGVDTLIEAAREWINGMLVNP